MILQINIDILLIKQQIMYFSYPLLKNAKVKLLKV